MTSDEDEPIWPWRTRQRWSPSWRHSLVGVTAVCRLRVYYWFSNRVKDPFTGETVLIDTSIKQEQALGLRPKALEYRQQFCE